MASASRVISVDYNQKHSLILIRDETFIALIAKVVGESSAKFTIECSENGTDWTKIENEVLVIPSLGVMECFNYKFVRINGWDRRRT